MTWDHWLLVAWPCKEMLAGMSMFLSAPRENDGAFYRLTYAAINALAYNFGRARNADRPT